MSVQVPNQRTIAPEGSRIGSAGEEPAILAGCPLLEPVLDLVRGTSGEAGGPDLQRPLEIVRVEAGVPVPPFRVGVRIVGARHAGEVYHRSL